MLVLNPKCTSTSFSIGRTQLYASKIRNFDILSQTHNCNYSHRCPVNQLRAQLIQTMHKYSTDAVFMYKYLSETTLVGTKYGKITDLPDAQPKV